MSNRRRPARPDELEGYVIALIDSPLTADLHLYDTQIAQRILRERNEKNPTTERPEQMSIPSPHRDSDELLRLTKMVANLGEQNASTRNLVLALTEDVRALRAEVEELRKMPRTRRERSDELADQILRVMRSAPGMRLSPTSVWESMPSDFYGTTNQMRVAEKLKRMAQSGMVQAVTRDNRRTLYFVEEPGDSSQG